MKKMMIAVIGIVAVFITVGMGHAQTRILKSSLACGQDTCEVYTLGRGTLEIVCVDKSTDGSLVNVSDYTCPTMGNKQTCTDKTSGKIVNVNPYDTDAVKCHKVCGFCI